MKTISFRQLALTFLPSVSILVAIAAVSVIYHVEMPDMTRDVASLGEIHPLAGVLSSLGVLLWCAAAAVCFFSALTLRNVTSKEIFRFLLSSALLTLYFLFDDFFQIHEALIPRYLGLDQGYVIVVLGVAVFAYLIAFGRVILRTDYGFFLLAVGFLGLSVVLDQVFEDWMMSRFDNWEYFVEDGAKWLGIASWCSYYVHTSYQFFVSRLGMPNSAIQSDAREAAARMRNV